MIKILIIEDHPIVRAGIKHVLSESAIKSSIAEAENGIEAFNKIRSQTFDIVLLDLSLPDISGVDVLRQIKNEQPSLKVLILSRYPEEQYALHCLKAGASGYLSKTSLASDLVQAIQKIVSGKEYISLQLAELMAGKLKNGDSELHGLHLSVREMDVLCRIASGLSITRIADEMKLGPTTISTYRARILKKLHLKSDADLVRYALDHQLV